MKDFIAVTVELDGGQSPRVITFKGREAWALGHLVQAGESGITPITRPAPRWSGYIFFLRRGGLEIETFREPHGGPYPGRHARYVLRSRVRVLHTVAA